MFVIVTGLLARSTGAIFLDDYFMLHKRACVCQSVYLSVGLQVTCDFSHGEDWSHQTVDSSLPSLQSGRDLDTRIQ